MASSSSNSNDADEPQIDVRLIKSEGKALTWRSLSALLFGAAVIQPLMIFLTLVGAGGLITLGLIGFGGGFGMAYNMFIFLNLGSQMLWLVVLFWVFLGRSFGKDITPQEAFIIFTFYPITVSVALIFVMPIFNLYVANSEIIEGLGLAQYIPPWWAPRGEDALFVQMQRSLLSKPILIPTAMTVLVTVLTLLCDLSLGIFAFQKYAVVEKLEFPMQSTFAQGLIAATGADPNKKRILMVSIFAGFLYSLGSFLIPSFLGTEIRIPPRGLADFTYVLETKYPGAVFGVDLTWVSIASGFVIPFKIVAAAAVTGLIAYTAGNYMLVKEGIWPDWAPGYGLAWDYARSNLYWWISVIIGLSIAAASASIGLHPRRLIRIFIPSKQKVNVQEEIPGKLLLALFLVASSAGILMFHLLIPDFPIHMLILLSIGWSIFATLVGTMAAGVYWGGTWIPYLKEQMIYYSGYRNPSAWFGRDFMLLSLGGISHASNLVMARFLNVSLKEYIKGFFFAMTVSIIFGFLFVSMFWRMAPIPSYTYPFTISGWPIMALETARWTKWLWTGILFKTDVIIKSALIGIAIAAISDFVFHAPWALISMIIGLTTLPSITLAQFAGAILSKVFERQFGKEKWNSIKTLVLIGLGIGDGLGIALGTAMMATAVSIWVLPY